MDRNKISADFHSLKDDYNKLGQNLVEALKIFLTEKDIPFLDIYYRVKKFDSFYQKLEKKNYENPFDETEDICGIRIICYYTSDIERINAIINEELKVIEEQDKSDLLGLKEFAYRSKHYIIKIKNEWLVTPNYKKLENLKAEIQIRTVLMHAWAEVEHKLNYKSDAQVPDKFQRKLFRLSAKFEEADEQFEELRMGIKDYKVKLDEKITLTDSFDTTQDFNIDSFKAFIKFHFPNDKLDDFRIIHNFDEYFTKKYTFSTMDNAIKILMPYFHEIKNDLNEVGYITNLDDEPSEFLAIALDIINDFAYELCIDDACDEWKEVVIKWRNKLINT